MFGKMKEMAGQFQMMQKMMQNEDFKAFVSHPKVQALFSDPDFKVVAKTRDFGKISKHPKFLAMAKDPEVATLMTKINPKDLQF